MGGQDTLNQWHTKQALADLLNRDVRTVTRMVARGEVEKDDSDPLHPLFRYKGRVAKASQPRTDRAEREKTFGVSVLAMIAEDRERIARLEAALAEQEEVIGFLRGAQLALNEGGQDGQQNESRPKVSLVRRLLSRYNRGRK